MVVGNLSRVSECVLSTNKVLVHPDENEGINEDRKSETNIGTGYSARPNTMDGDFSFVRYGSTGER